MFLQKKKNKIRLDLISSTDCEEAVNDTDTGARERNGTLDDCQFDFHQSACLFGNSPNLCNNSDEILQIKSVTWTKGRGRTSGNRAADTCH